MSLAKPILLAFLAVALAAYAFDCGAASTPEQAMQCCNSMNCSSAHHHGQDCCKAMSAMHAPFVQPSFVHSVPYSPRVFAVLSALVDPQTSPSPDRLIASHCHAPPILSVPSLIPLRI